MRHIPNLITLIRMILVAPIVVALLRDDLVMATVLFAAAAVSDGIDGFLARRFGWRSSLGSILDPLADKALLVTMFITLGLLGKLPRWLMAAAIARDVVILVGALAYRWRIGRLTAHPSAVSKLNTACQALFILALVAHAKFSLPPPWVATLLGAVAFALIVVSGLDYVLVYAGRAAKAPAAS